MSVTGRWDAGRWGTPLLVLLGATNIAALSLGLAAEGTSPARHLWAALSLCGLLCVVALAVALRHLAQARARIAAMEETARQPPAELEPLRAQLRACEARLHEVMDAVPGGMALYDNQDRLLACNRMQAAQPPYAAGEPLVGQSYEALLRRALRDGAFPDAAGQEEEWLALRLAHRTGQAEPALLHRAEGPWVHLFEHHTPSGYLVMTRLDIAPLVEKSMALARAEEHRQRLMLVDGTTGIANRRQFDQSLRGEWQRGARTRSSVAVLVIDVDHFKAYNDHYGQRAGEHCLRQVALVLGACIQRSGELFARFGGEAFAALLPGADAEEARRVAERCMQALRNAALPHATSPLSPWLSVSVGIAVQVAEPGRPVTLLLEQAETAVMRAKQAGRARAELFA